MTLNKVFQFKIHLSKVIIIIIFNILQKTKLGPIHIGLLCAMPEEIGLTKRNLKNIVERSFGDFIIFSGKWKNLKNFEQDIYVSLAWSGWGKVSSSRAATRMIASPFNNMPLDFILFTGVAGAAKSELKQWDIIIPNKLVQHDMDASPLFLKYVIPSINKKNLYQDLEWFNWANNTISDSLKNNKLKSFGKLRNGLVASGDQFINDISIINKLSKELKNLSAVEMEGAAVAQVAIQEKIPFLIIRVISDSADDSASQNFNDFLKIYEKESCRLIEILINNLNESPLKIY